MIRRDAGTLIGGTRCFQCGSFEHRMQNCTFHRNCIKIKPNGMCFHMMFPQNNNTTLKKKKTKK